MEDLFELINAKNHGGLKTRLERKKDDLEFLNCDGKTALCVAVEQNYLIGMGLLIEAKSNVNFITQHHQTLLDMAMSKSFSVAAQMLYDNGGKWCA